MAVTAIHPGQQLAEELRALGMSASSGLRLDRGELISRRFDLPM